MNCIISSMIKKLIMNILKLAIASGLIYWLIQSDKIDFTLLKKVFSQPLIVISAILMMQADNFIVTYRLRLILQIKAQRTLSLLKMFLANWIGIFFNSVLPGSVSGDLIKIFYIKDIDTSLTKKFLFLSVFMDRVIGLLGLICVGGLFSILNYSNLVALSSDVQNLVHLNILLTIVVLSSLFILFKSPSLPIFIAKPFRKVPFIGKVTTKLEEIWNDLCTIRTQLLKVLFLSGVIQSVAIFIFWFLVHPYAQGNFDIVTAFTIMPVGFISIAIPIAPAGLGVGHVVFQKLLQFFSISNGASLFNIYFVVVMLSNLSGIIPYVLYSKKNLPENEDIKNLD